MIDRYKQLYSEMRLIEHQLKDLCKVRFGKEIAFRMMSKKKTFVAPETFKEILGGKDGKK